MVYTATHEGHGSHNELQSVVLPHRLAHNKVEALVLSVGTTKMCLKNVDAESQLFADCHTVGQLVSKLDQSLQDIWFHYHALRLQLPEHVSFESWLMQEGRAAAQQRICTLAAKYQAIQNANKLVGDSCKEGVERAEKVMETRSFGVEASREQLRSPACSNHPTKQKDMAQQREAAGK